MFCLGKALGSDIWMTMTWRNFISNTQWVAVVSILVQIEFSWKGLNNYGFESVEG